jgi:8-amino-7-oxononanoate synthase
MKTEIMAFSNALVRAPPNEISLPFCSFAFPCSAMPLHDRISAALESRASRQMLRSLATGPPNESLVDFSSNDYLSLSQSASLRQNLLTVLSSHTSSTQFPSPYGPPSSRLLDGNSSSHISLEFRLASFFLGQSALLFNSGFDANVGLWSVLPGPEDWIVYDEFVHASTHDGMRAGRTRRERRVPFGHNSVEDFERVVRRIVEEREGQSDEGKRGDVWVAVEALYSMDGDLCPLEDVVRIVESLLPRKNTHIVVDEVRPESIDIP